MIKKPFLILSYFKMYWGWLSMRPNLFIEVRNLLFEIISLQTVMFFILPDILV